METKAVLEAVQAKIRDPLHWCQGNYAKDNKGESVDPISVNAVQFCSIGALIAVTNKDDTDDYNRARKLMEQAANDLFSTVMLVHVNDVQGHAAVMQMFERAKELAK